MPQISAGILLYRIKNNEPEVFLVHPGGPFFAKKDKGFWTIPKGLPNENEELPEAAKREFFEETGFKPTGEFYDLGNIKQKGGKTVHAWAVENDIPENFKFKCNTFTIEWPPRSGKMQEFAEVDQFRFFKIKDVLEYINPAQAAFIERLLEIIQL